MLRITRSSIDIYLIDLRIKFPLLYHVVVITELETLMMDILNPVRFISISPVNTFDFQLNSLFGFWLAVRFLQTILWFVEFQTLFLISDKDKINLRINKKLRLNIDLEIKGSRFTILHTKVPTSGNIYQHSLFQNRTKLLRHIQDLRTKGHKDIMT